MKQNDTKYLVIGQKEKRYYTNPGEEYYIEREYVGLDEDNQWILEPINKVKISDYINSFADQTDMATIIRRLQEGDGSVLNQRAAFYGDFVNVPHTPMEALTILKDSRLAYEKLSDETKEKFNNDFQKWFASCGSVDWFDKMGLLKKEEVPSDVQKETPAVAES